MSKKKDPAEKQIPMTVVKNDTKANTRNSGILLTSDSIGIYRHAEAG